MEVGGGGGGGGGIQECEEGTYNKLFHCGCGSSGESFPLPPFESHYRPNCVTAPLPLSNAGPLTSGANILEDGALGQ